MCANNVTRPTCGCYHVFALKPTHSKPCLPTPVEDSLGCTPVFGERRRRHARDAVYADMTVGEVAQPQTHPHDGYPQGRGLDTLPSQSPWLLEEIQYARLPRSGSQVLTACGTLVGDTVAVNPEISSGLPIASVHRYPPPGSRPEKYSTPATKGSKRELTSLV